ncbi:MAG: EscU/YscU/HrcU family type III secretion system export apparatus switch protein [Deltaproteobacteria bacterium]|nr:EscU/YscU/HrcU family type III secretion system export apparatus switch protein [Deltaproteobacteria bacterium]
MPEDSQAQEKTEEATPKRLREARKKGQVAKSRDLNTIIILIAAFGLIAAMIPFITRQINKILLGSFEFVRLPVIHDEQLLDYLNDAFMAYVAAIVPYVLIIVVLAIAVGFLQIGPIFSAEPIKPQWKRLNIVENVKNMAKVTTLVELVKNIIKVVLIFYLAYYVIKNNIDQILLTILSDLPNATKVAGSVITGFLLRVFVVFIIVAILDVMVQRWHYKKQLRMTKEEVKREYKQDEGDPIIKSARKQLHQELAMGDTRQAIAASDAVITNPTHVAVAVKYDEKEMMAPQIMAKGQRWFAEKIKEFAKETGTPIIENPPVAWALVELDVGDEIPETLYQVVAEVLVYVYRLKEKPAEKSPRTPS